MPKTKASTGIVRIIAGTHRSRKVLFDPNSIRPTTDRVRETVFNWLTPYIHDAKCLDLFAGSGVLAFEAISRGAKSVLMIDKKPKHIEKLKENQLHLQLKNCDIRLIHLSLNSPKISNEPFDIIFLDPPYQKNLLLPTLTWLLNTDALHSQTIVYVECEIGFDLCQRPIKCEVLRYKKTQHIQFALLTNFKIPQ